MSLAASHGTIRRIRRSSLSAATAREKDDFPITLSGPPSPPQRRTASTQGQHLPSAPGRPAAPIDYAPAGVPAASGGVALPTGAAGALHQRSAPASREIGSAQAQLVFPPPDSPYRCTEP